MKNRSRAVISAFTIITITAMLLSAACAPRVEVALASTPEPTVSVTAAPTATPTVAPTSIPTPAVDEYGFTEERKAELNQQFHDFLNKEGEFTPEKMSQIMMEFYDGNGIDFATRLDMNAAGLGISSYQPHIQGYFFDYFLNEGRVILLLGFDGKDGNRFITPVEIPFYFFEAVDMAKFYVTTSSVNNINGIDYSNKNRNTVQFGECYDGVFCGDTDTLLHQLDLIKGNVISIVLDVWEYEVSALDEADLDEEDYNKAVEYLNENNSKIGLSFGLLELVISNDIDYKRFMEKIIDSDISSIQNIETLDGIDEIEISRTPMTRDILVFDGILN